MAKKSGYPDTYGRPTSAIPDILGPLNIDEEGDKLVPPNDMSGVAPDWNKGQRLRDPMGYLTGIDK